MGISHPGTTYSLPEYRGTLFIRERTLLGPYCRPMSSFLWGSWGVGVFLSVRYPCRLTMMMGIHESIFGGNDSRKTQRPPPVRIPDRMPGACVLHASVPVFPSHVQPL